MEKPQRFPAVLNYLLPVIGWIYVGIFHRKNSLATFHLRQSVGLFLFLVLITAAWAVVGWILAWIPYVFVATVVLFVLPMTAYFVGAILWVVGMINALAGRETPLPMVGGFTARLPIF